MSRLLVTEEQREAKRAYEREWRKRKYAEDPVYRERKKATDSRWAESMVNRVDAYKLSQGCKRCGFDECARALQFHHPNDDKEFNISNMKRKRSWEAVFAEIQKCEVLCANHHAMEHCVRACSSVGEYQGDNLRVVGSNPTMLI